MGLDADHGLAVADRGGWNSEWDAGYGASYSMMVYAPGTTHIEGYVYLFAPGLMGGTRLG